MTILHNFQNGQSAFDLWKKNPTQCSSKNGISFIYPFGLWSFAWHVLTYFGSLLWIFLTTTAFSLNFTLPNLEILLVNIWGVGSVNKMLAVRYENRCSDSLEPMEKPGVKVKFEGQKKK